MSRKFGQHFLAHEPTLQRIATAACGAHSQRVVEIGPGRGALTRHLLPLVDELYAIEIDESLVRSLRGAFTGETKLQVLKADVLKTDLAQWGPAVVVGNLPYYITSPILEHFLALDARFTTGIFMMQWEVALRLMAKAKTRDFGYLTVATQLVTDVELIAKVDRQAFNPPPNVDSAVVRLTRKTDIPADLKEILKFAGWCLTHKRKTIRNNLKPYYGSAADNQPEGGLRGEQLGIPGLVTLYRRLAHVSLTSGLSPSSEQ